MPSTDLPRYRFGPLERRGIIGGLRKSQASLLGVGLVVGVLALRLAPNGPNALLALAALALAALIAFVPIQGRSLEEWTPVVVRFLWRRLSGSDAYRSPAPQLGALARVPTDPDRADDAARLVELAEALPDELDTIGWLSVPYRARAVGVVKDTAQNSYAVALRCRVQAFGLLDAAQQARRLAEWGRVLSGLAGERSPIRRIAWVERTVPSDGDAIARYFSEARDDTVPLSSGAARSYIELIDSAGQVTQDHEIDLVLQADGQRLFRKAKKLVDQTEQRLRSRAERREAIDQACGRLLVREAATLAGRLERAGVRVEGVLSPGMFPRAIKDPGRWIHLAVAKARSTARLWLNDGPADHWDAAPELATLSDAVAMKQAVGFAADIAHYSHCLATTASPRTGIVVRREFDSRSRKQHGAEVAYQMAGLQPFRVALQTCSALDGP